MLCRHTHCQSQACPSLQSHSVLSHPSAPPSEGPRPLPLHTADHPTHCAPETQCAEPSTVRGGGAWEGLPRQDQWTDGTVCIGRTAAAGGGGGLSFTYHSGPAPGAPQNTAELTRRTRCRPHPPQGRGHASMRLTCRSSAEAPSWKLVVFCRGTGANGGRDRSIDHTHTIYGAGLIPTIETTSLVR